jgi:hypothetical protein
MPNSRIKISSRLGQALQRSATLGDFEWQWPELRPGEIAGNPSVADVTISDAAARQAMQLGLVEDARGNPPPRWKQIVRWSAKGREVAARALLTETFVEVEVDNAS